MLDDRDAWEEFLKLLTLYSSDIIDDNLLLQLALPFLGGAGSELDLMFRDIVGVDRTKMINPADAPKYLGHAHGFVVNGAVAANGSGYLAGSKHRYGPSYRRLPDSETKLACSGRDELCRSVLNDDWVSHPTWASEDAGFVAHKKNSFEEALHKSEEERHEYHVQLEAMAYTISLLEPIAYRVADMSSEERATFKLGPDLGGRSKAIHQKIIKRVYGRENTQEVLQALQDNPAVAVPVVLDRLKAVDAEWRKNKREWEKVWREVDARNFYKSLDHQGVGFKANDKKAITGKALITEIERIKKTQDNARDGVFEEDEKALGGKSRQDTDGEVDLKNAATVVLPRHQLAYTIQDESVLQDAIKLTLGYLERSDSRQASVNVPQYNAVERRRIEAFLRHYVMYQFGFGPEFDLAFGPAIEQAEWEDLGLYVADGAVEDSADEDASKSRRCLKKSGGAVNSSMNGTVSAGDLKKKLNKAKRTLEKAGDSKPSSGANTSNHPSPSTSREPSPVSGSSPPLLVDKARSSKGKALDERKDDVWIRHVKLGEPEQQDGMDISPVESQSKRKTFGSFFCNTNFYTLIRLLQVRVPFYLCLFHPANPVVL